MKVFGVALDQLPRGALCATSVGDQSHVLPLVVYKLVEDMYRRGGSYNTPLAEHAAHVLP